MLNKMETVVCALSVHTTVFFCHKINTEFLGKHRTKDIKNNFLNYAVFSITNFAILLYFRQYLTFFYEK